MVKSSVTTFCVCVCVPSHRRRAQAADVCWRARRPFAAHQLRYDFRAIFVALVCACLVFSFTRPCFDAVAKVNLLYVCPLSVNFSSLSAPGVANVRNIACEVHIFRPADFRTFTCRAVQIRLLADDSTSPPPLSQVCVNKRKLVCKQISMFYFVYFFAARRVEGLFFR